MTFEQSATARERAQRAVDQINQLHDDVVYVTIQKAKGLIDWPDDAEVLGYYSLRGLDRSDADAVVCVGTAHPAEDDLRADAQVLATDRDDVRVGGRELSTQQADDVGPPVYRKYNYVDDEGGGRAIVSKTYIGLVGGLFDGRHADEIEQAAHRHRPILATEDDPKYVYLLTNVATDLPIDRLMTYDALLNPVEEWVDVRDSALDLLDVMVDAAQDPDPEEEYADDGRIYSIATTGPEWEEAAEKAELDVSKRTVRNALDDLRDAGLVEEGDYVPRRGRLQTLTELGARVANSL